MKKILVEICACTECVMKGAMDLEESIEDLKKLKTQLKISAPVKVEINKCLGEGKHADKSPLVMVNGELIENANSETVMAKIMSLSAEEQQAEEDNQ